MASANKSPLGFPVIIAFHLCVLLWGIILQGINGHPTVWFTLGDFAVRPIHAVLLATAAFVLASGWFMRRFYWDLFRSFKSAGVLLTMLVLSCVLGTMLIQDLDLRRNRVFDKGLAPEGQELPEFDDRNQSTRFAIAEASLLSRIFSDEQRDSMLEEKVRLSDFEKAQVSLRREAFGDRAAKSFEDAVLASKERNVNQISTTTFARKYHKQLYGFFERIRSLHLFDIFESWWFAMLLGLIALNVIVGTFARAPWNLRDLGLVITHAGILIILAGALADYLKAKEGYIYFTYGIPEEQIAWSIEDQKNQVRHNLPFRVRLDRFATEYYHELQVERVDWSRRNDGRPANGESAGSPFFVADTFPIRTGVPRVFEQGAIRVNVLDYKPRVFVKSKIGDDPHGAVNPAVKVALYNNPMGGRNFFVQGNAEPWLFARDRRRDHIQIKSSRFEYVWAPSGLDYDRLLQTPPVPDNGELVLRSGDGAPVRVRVMIGAEQTVEVAGRPVRIEFLSIGSAIGDSKSVNLDSNLQAGEEPVLFVRVDGKSLPVPRDDSEFLSDFEILEGVSFRFDWPDTKDRGVRRIYRVVDADGREPVLVQLDPAGNAAVSPIGGVNRPALIGLKGGYLGLDKRVRSAIEQRAIHEVTDEQFLAEGGGSDDHLLAAWADVEITGPNGQKLRQEMTPFDQPIFFDFDENGQPRYVFQLVKTKTARDWFSVLSVIDHDDRVVMTHNVQVNSPLRYGGYRFFQATAQPDRGDGLGISGISVTKNPGVIGMYTGYTVLTLGVCWIFFLKPILDRRRRRRRRVEAVPS